jgi:hypothetical protein
MTLNVIGMISSPRFAESSMKPCPSVGNGVPSGLANAFAGTNLTNTLELSRALAASCARNASENVTLRGLFTGVVLLDAVPNPGAGKSRFMFIVAVLFLVVIFV